MKKKITLIMLFLLMGGAAVNAADYVNKVIIVSEGHYDFGAGHQTIPVTVGAYDPTTQTYAVFDTIYDAQFATHVIVDGSSIYVAADSILVRYDADSYQRLATTTIHGMRKLAVWNNELLVSIGDYRYYGAPFTSFFIALDKANLGFLYDLPSTPGAGPEYATEGIIVKDNIAYVAVGNGFDYGHEKGLIGRVDLTNHTYINEVTLGAGGTNPEGMFIDNDNIYTVNNTNYSATSISTMSISALSASTVNLSITGACGASTLTPGFVLYQGSTFNQLGRFNVATSTVQDTLMINKNIYGMTTDMINNLCYIGETDYTTFGKIFIYDFAGTVQSSFNVGVAPGNIALDVRTTVSVKNESTASRSLNCYPNPAHDEVLVTTGNKDSGDTYIVTDLTGREVKRINSELARFTVDIHTFEAGVYVLTSASNPSDKVKIVKQ